MNTHAIRAIYRFEMARTRRTLMQSIAAPVLSTSLYFIVFGGAIGSRIATVEGVSYGSFIVPGLILMTMLTWITQLPRFYSSIHSFLGCPQRLRTCSRVKIIYLIINCA